MRRKVFEYFTPLRKAARLQLRKKRSRAHELYRERVFHCAAVVLQKFGRVILNWYRILRILRQQRKLLLEWRSAKRIQRFGKWIIFTCRYKAAVAARWVQIRYEQMIAKHSVAANKIGYFWKRFVQKSTLHNRFQLRGRVLKERDYLMEQRRIADVEKFKAIKEKLRAGM